MLNNPSKIPYLDNRHSYQAKAIEREVALSVGDPN